MRTGGCVFEHKAKGGNVYGTGGGGAFRQRSYLSPLTRACDAGYTLCSLYRSPGTHSDQPEVEDK